MKRLKMDSHRLRARFLDFYRLKKHKIADSDSLVPVDDPTVLFTPAGMNQFKQQFLGVVGGFRRAATAQRCLRTDDLDKVGKTSGHHSFFEMLGNFSFGDYFKEEAISWAWEFLTEELSIDKDKLSVSVHWQDEEAYQLWRNKIKLATAKIIKLSDKDNFWPSDAPQKGPNGPCGPCSEIFFDQGRDYGCRSAKCGPGCCCGRFLEVWNLVFTQFNRKDGGLLEPLPQKNIDTGMGLERLAAIMQGVPSNFETDLFLPLTEEISRAARGADNINLRELIFAVADHIRAVCFVIYDGVLPSNEGRGYVARKLIRKSSLHLRQLGIVKPYLYKLAYVVAQIMSQPYPELSLRRENIARIIQSEEENFISVVDSSDKLLKAANRRLLAEYKNSLPLKTGKTAGRDDFSVEAAVTAFKLYDTHGVPLEITRHWLLKQNIQIDPAVFEKTLRQHMDIQKKRSQEQSLMKGDVFDEKQLHMGNRTTLFLGYSKIKTTAKILKLINDYGEIKKAEEPQAVSMILDKTVFYPESGGQSADSGVIKKGRNCFEVTGVKKAGRIILHTGVVKQGSFKAGMEVEAAIDIRRRHDTARNHTATHLLQAALRKVLGVHVKQQGSLVEPARLRFDFTHFKPVSKDELERVEEEINGYILENLALTTRVMDKKQAKQAGALAFFGEKYADKVRIVSVPGVSKEFCGGTHLKATAEVGLFKIISECSVSSGVRRIEAETGLAAYKTIKKELAILNEAGLLLNAPLDKFIQELSKRIGRIKELEKYARSQKSLSAAGAAEELINQAEDIGGVNFISAVLKDCDMNSLRSAVDTVKTKLPNLIIALGTVENSRNALLVMGTNLEKKILEEKRLLQSDLIKEAACLIDGSGGGRNDFAQAGGSKPENFPAAFQRIRDILKQRLGG